MPSTLVESFELLIEAEVLGPRLAQAAAALEQLAELEDEKRWLGDARARLATAGGAASGGLLERALRLPELEALRGGERGKALQGAVADEIERLQAGIAFAGGTRSPLLEMVFHNLKVPALRKCGRPELDRFCAELERRLTTSYSKRILAGESYRAVAEAVQVLGRAIATWRSVFIDPPPAEAEAAVIRDELVAAGTAVELAVRQARLLAHAALLPTLELLDAAGVATAKAKRRGKDADDDRHPLLDRDPPDPLQPTAEERAELEG